MILPDLILIAGLNTINIYVTHTYATNYWLLFLGNLGVLFAYDHLTKKRIDNTIFNDL